MEFATPAALGSHKRKHREPKAKANDGEVTIRLLVEQAPIESKQSDDYKCPDCGGSLELMKDSPGIYKLRCHKCWSEA
jgi:DNA-directed RNA polymerase subunit RPC12/RpoP